MRASLPPLLLPLYIALACVLLVAAALLAGWPLPGEEPPPLHGFGPAVEGLPTTPGPSPKVPQALVGRSIWGSAAPTPVPASSTDWVQTLRKTALWSGPSSSREVIAQLPQGYPLKVAGTQGRRLLVYYGGGGYEEPATEGWVEQSDVAPVPAPRWVVTRWETGFRSGQGGQAADQLPGGAVLEVLEERGRELRVFHLGDGQDRDAAEGWVKASDVGAAGAMLAAERRGMRVLSRSEVAALRAGDGLWLKIPFRTQLDGSPAASANCGPASVGMALEFLRGYVSTEELRGVANRLQGTWGPDSGFGIQYLAGLAEQFGLRAEQLSAGGSFRRWNLEEMRSHLFQGHPVIPELRFRLMPGRAESGSWDDHYVVITGTRGDEFIYNDSVDVDGPGYARVMSAEELLRAWGGSDFPFAAFALSKPQ